MTASDGRLRVSVATLDRVVFQSPRDGTQMLALERKATLLDTTDAHSVFVRAQPFGGAVRLLNSDALRALLGDVAFDSRRSEAERDFRLLIRPADWESIKHFCLEHLLLPDDPVLEADPSRELVEEFAESLQLTLRPDHYVYQQAGFVVENDPTPTDNTYSRGFPTVRIYRIFDVRIVDDSVSLALLTASESLSDAALQARAVHDAQATGRGRANTVLALPLKRVRDFYLNLSPAKRYAPGYIEAHRLDRSVAAVLGDVDVPQFQRC
jgi:hypothetical protein